MLHKRSNNSPWYKLNSRRSSLVSEVHLWICRVEAIQRRHIRSVPLGRGARRPQDIRPPPGTSLHQQAGSACQSGCPQILSLVLKADRLMLLSNLMRTLWSGFYELNGVRSYTRKLGTYVFHGYPDTRYYYGNPLIPSHVNQSPPKTFWITSNDGVRMTQRQALARQDSDALPLDPTRPTLGFPGEQGFPFTGCPCSRGVIALLACRPPGFAEALSGPTDRNRRQEGVQAMWGCWCAWHGWQNRAGLSRSTIIDRAKAAHAYLRKGRSSD